MKPSKEGRGNDYTGATLVEYALILALVILAVVWFRTAFITSAQQNYDSKKESLNYLNKTPLFTPTPVPSP